MRQGMAAMAILQTPNLTLRPCRPDDRADFVALERDAEVMRYLNGGAVDHATIDPGAAGFLMPRGSEPDVWAARLTVDRAFVGWFCLSPEGQGRAELGYRLRRVAWGRGLASEGAAALVAWGFGAAGHDAIVASTMAVNRASRRVMEKLGMRHVRTDFPVFAAPIPGTEHGEVRYELTRDEWVAGGGRVGRAIP